MGCFSQPSQSVQQHATLTPEQNAALSQMLSLTTESIGQVDPYQFQGNRVAALGDLTQQGLGAAGQLGQQGQQAIGSLLDPMAQGGALDAIFGRGQDMFGRESERIATKFGAANVTSSSGARDAQNRALEQFTLASQARAAPFALQSQAAGLGAIPGLQQGLFQSGGIQQDQQQNLVNEQIANAQRQNPLFNPAMQATSGLVGLPAFENIGINHSAGLGSSLLGGFVGGLGSGMGGLIGK